MLTTDKTDKRDKHVKNEQKVFCCGNESKHVARVLCAFSWLRAQQRIGPAQVFRHWLYSIHVTRHRPYPSFQTLPLPCTCYQTSALHKFLDIGSARVTRHRPYPGFQTLPLPCACYQTSALLRLLDVGSTLRVSLDINIKTLLGRFVDININPVQVCRY